MDRIAASQAFVRIVELGSFTAAARDLRLRQATVSRWIDALEDALGVRLLDRTTRAVRVTEAGERFYLEARALLAAWTTATTAVRAREGEIAGRLRVSVPVVFGQAFITPNLPALLRRHPALELEVLFSDRYVDLVEEGVDVAVRVGRPLDTEYRARTLAVTPRRLVAAPTYLAERGAPADPAELAGHECLLHSGLDPGAIWRFGDGDDAPRVAVTGRFRANHSATLRALALAGHGVALLASWLVDEDLRAGRLVALLPGFAAPPAPIQAILSSRRHVPPTVRAFVDFLAEALAGLSTPDAPGEPPPAPGLASA